MSNMLNHLKRMMNAAESVGSVTRINMGDWLDAYDRISIAGKTNDGRKFEMTLEIDKEGEKNAEELE